MTGEQVVMSEDRLRRGTGMLPVFRRGPSVARASRPWSGVALASRLLAAHPIGETPMPPQTLTSLPVTPCAAYLHDK